MSFGHLGSLGAGFGKQGARGGANAASFADGVAAPSGFHWEFVTDDTDGSRVVDDATGQPVVDLVAN